MRRRAVHRAKRRADSARPALAVQAKLRAGPRNDPLESEADRVAEQVVAATPGPDVQQAPIQHTFSVQRQEGPGAPQAKAASGVEPEIEGSIASQSARGTPLGRQTRRYFEDRLGTPLEPVRTHSDGTANRLAHSLKARAFTVGEHIFFASGQFSPDSQQGRRLMAHELTHTLQQRGTNASERLLQKDDDATAETVPTKIDFNFTGTLQTPPCGTRKLKATTDGKPVTWTLEAGTAKVDSGSEVDPKKGTIKIGSSQKAGVIKVKAEVPSGNFFERDLRIGAHPTGITSTRLEADPPADHYGHVYEHVFESSDGDVSHLQGVPVGERFPGLANPRGASHKIKNPPYPFGPSFTLNTATLTADASNNWFLTSAGELGGDHDEIAIAQANIDVGLFVQSASNPTPKGRLPVGFTIDQHLHWYCPQEASAKKRWTDFVTVAHSRTLKNDSGSLSLVTTVNGVEDGGDDYVGPSAVTNLAASPVSTPRSSGPPSGGGAAPAPRSVDLAVDTLPSPLPSSETLSWSFVGKDLGCSVTPDASDSTRATLTIGTTGGNVTVQVADATGANFDRVTVRIT